MAIVCMVIVSIYASSVLTSIINFILSRATIPSPSYLRTSAFSGKRYFGRKFLLHRAGVFTHRGIEATPAKYCLEQCEAGEEDEDRAPGGGDGP